MISRIWPKGKKNFPTSATTQSLFNYVQKLTLSGFNRKPIGAAFDRDTGKRAGTDKET